VRTRVIVTALLGLAALYFLVPVYWLIVSTTKNSAGLFSSFGLWFSHPDPVKYLGQLFSFDGGIYLRWGLNSLIYSGVGALGATLFAAAAGYALAKLDFRGREALFNIVLAGVLLPTTALALPLYMLFSQVHLADTYWAVLLPSMVSPFGVYLCRIYAEASVPDELVEAGRVDGAGEVRIFSRVALRIMTPALVTVFLFQFVGIWNNYFLPLAVLSDQKLYPITLGLASWNGIATRQPVLYQLTVGGAFVSVVPLMILMVALQRFWRTGLTEGSYR
jgi:multiple sugar transport system permease protein